MKKVIILLMMLVSISVSSPAQVPASWPRADNGVPILKDGKYKITKFTTSTGNSRTSRIPKANTAFLFVNNNGRFITVAGDGIVVQRHISDIMPTTVSTGPEDNTPVVAYQSTDNDSDGTFVLWPNDNPSISNICDIDFNFAGTAYSITVDLNSRVDFYQADYDSALGFIHKDDIPLPFQQGRYEITDLGKFDETREIVVGYLYYDEANSKIRIRHPSFNEDLILNSLVPCVLDELTDELWYLWLNDEGKIWVDYVPEIRGYGITIIPSPNQLPIRFYYDESSFQGATDAQIKKDF